MHIDILARSEAINQLLLLFVIVALGSIIGHIKVKGVSLGPAAVLFIALLFSALDPRLELPIIIGHLGLAMFAYLIGLASGPMFFSAVKTNSKIIVVVIGAIVAAALIAVGVGQHLLGLNRELVAGAFVGSLTNTPALAAAGAAAPGKVAADVTVGYSLTYLIGVIVMMAAVAWAVRRGERHPSERDLDTPPPLVHESVRIDKDGLPNLGFIVAGFHNQVVFSRTMRDGHVEVAVDDFAPTHGDIVTIIGPSHIVEQAVEMLGHKSGIHLALDRSELDFRRIAVTNSQVAGRTISDLNLAGQFGAVATRVRRGNVDMLASDDLVLQLGDRVRVTASRTRMPAVAKFLGDSERETGEVNPIGFAIGMSLGLLLGLVVIPIGTSNFSFGDALGPLLVGLLLGRAQRTGPIVWSVPYPAAEALRNFGVLAFLAYAGSHSGAALVDSFKTNSWYKVIALGLLIVVTSALIQEVFGRGLLKTSGAQMAGTLAGSETQPAVLAYATERAAGDPRVALGYALVYPVAMVLKVVLAPLIITLF